MTRNSSEPSASAFSRLETLTAVAVIGVLALALGLAALVMPTRTSEQRSAEYVQSGEFGYTGETPDDSIYGEDGLSTGEPILAREVGRVKARFAYAFETEDPADLRGTAGLVATVELDQGLTRSFTVAEEKEFTGAETTVAGRLPVGSMVAYVRESQEALGDAGYGMQATLTLTPEIETEGTLDGHALDATYAPELVFLLEGTTFTLTEGDPTAAAPTTADPLEPSDPGELTYQTEVANTVPLLVVEPSVTLARWVGLAVAGLCLLLGLVLARPLMRSGDRIDESARIRTLYGARLVEVSGVQLKGGPVADVAGIDALAELAKRYESMIMHVRRPEGDVYLVWDNGLTYRYRPARPTGSRAADLSAENGQGDEDVDWALLAGTSPGVSEERWS